MHIKTNRAKRRNEALEFIQGMTRELRDMALAERCDSIAYLIEMAYLEVSDEIRKDFADSNVGGRSAIADKAA